MSRTDSLRGCVLLGALCLWLATQAAGAEPLTITFVSPGAGSTVAPEFSVAIRLTEDGRPFTEAGLHRWARATICDQRGQAVARLPLHDNGQGYDQVRGDGEWTAPAHVRLLDGQYRLIVVVRHGKQREQRQTSFTVSSVHAPPSTPVPGRGAIAPTNPVPLEARLGELAAQVRALAARQPSEGRLFFLMVVVSLFAILVIVALALLDRLYVRRPAPFAAALRAPAGERHPPAPQAAAGEPHPAALRTVTSEPRPAALLAANGEPRPVASHQAGEKWPPLFAALESIQSAAREIGQDLSSTFQAHQKVTDQWKRLAGEVVSLSQSLASVKALPPPAARALKAHLGTLLSDAGIETWEPAVGEPAPPECEQQPGAESGSAPPLTVTKVQARGYRMRHGDGWIVLVRPVVAVGTNPPGEGKT